MKDIAVIVLNYKTWDDTLNVVHVLQNKFMLDDSQIIVVDNNSPNESAVRLEKESKGCFQLLTSSENRGYASGNNIGLKHAYNQGFKYGFVVNNDIVFSHDDILMKLKSIFEKDEHVAVASPDVYYPNGKLYNRNSKRPNIWDMTFGLIQFKKKSRTIIDLGEYGYVYRPQGCCMMINLQKLEEVDFLDENTFLYCEEAILAERLLSKGYKCAVCTSTSIIHNHSKTVRSTIDRKRIEMIRLQSNNYLLRQYRRFPAWKIKLSNIFDKLIIHLTS